MVTNSTVIENVSTVFPYGDIGSFITGIATAVLVGVLIWQTALTRKQIKLSHLPYLTPRFAVDGGIIQLLIVNVGNGNAVDVHLMIHDESKQELARIDRFALNSAETAHTGVDLQKNKKVKITGNYLDLNNKKYKVEQAYEYPPKRSEKS